MWKAGEIKIEDLVDKNGKIRLLSVKRTRLLGKSGAQVAQKTAVAAEKAAKKLAKSIKFDESIYDHYTYKEWNKLKFSGKKTISIDDLIITQDTVKTQQVLDISKEFDVAKLKIKVIEKDGKYYVMDGHHSLAAAYANGMKNVEVMIEKSIK
jgi:hypothetical protein